jgi:hypothetical protein
MNRRRVFFCAAIALLLSLAIATPRALADDPNRQTQLKISIWPEYDQPTVLVMLDGTLADDTNLPREVSVLIPSSASLLVTTFENQDGTLAAEQQSKSANQGDGYSRVTYTLKTPKYHVEYYDNLLRGSPDKVMDFAFKAVALIDQVTVEIQQPLKASNFSVNLPSPSMRDDNGFKLYSSPFANVAGGQTLTAQVKYTKTDPNPSVVPAVAPASVPSTTPAATAPSMWSNVFLIVALVLLALVAVLGFIILQQRARRPVSVMAGSRSGSRKQARRQAAARRAFCTECGSALGPEDDFCPKCGAPRRAA